jgi:hypothetical protein
MNYFLCLSLRYENAGKELKSSIKSLLSTDQDEMDIDGKSELILVSQLGFINHYTYICTCIGLFVLVFCDLLYQLLSFSINKKLKDVLTTIKQKIQNNRIILTFLQPFPYIFYFD